MAELFCTVVAEDYRKPMIVSEVFYLRKNVAAEAFPICPRCRRTMEREYQSFCDRCGQKLDWRNYHHAAAIVFGEK